MNRMTRPRARDVVEQALDALLQLAAEAGAGQQAPHVERAHGVVGQVLGHVAGGDALGQSLDDRGLAHARLADQQRVVLAPPAEHVDQLADLRLAPDDRVELAIAGQAGEVDGVLGERSRRVGPAGGAASARRSAARRCRSRAHVGQRRRASSASMTSTASTGPVPRRPALSPAARRIGRRPSASSIASSAGAPPGSSRRGGAPPPRAGRPRSPARWPARLRSAAGGGSSAASSTWPASTLPWPEPAGDPARTAEQLLDLVGGGRR